MTGPIDFPLMEFSYNKQVHSSMCCMPFELDSRQHPAYMGVEPLCSSLVEAANDFVRQLMNMQTKAKAALS